MPTATKNNLRTFDSQHATTKQRELFGWCGVMSWLFLMIYAYDIFLLDTMAYFEGGSWLLFFFMLLYALCVGLCGWFFGSAPESLGKIAFFTTPAAIVITVLLGFLPQTLTMVLYMLTAVLMAPVTARRAYGVIQTGGSGDRFFNYACGFAASFVAFAVWLVIKPPKEIAFLFPAVLTIPAWIGTGRGFSPASVHKTEPAGNRIKFSKQFFVLIAAAVPVVFTVILMGRIILTSIFAGLGEPSSSAEPAALDTFLTWIPPAICMVLFGIINDKGHERLSFIVFIGLSLSGILLAFIPGATKGMILIPLIFAFCFGEMYAEFFVYSSPIYFVHSMKRPVFTASVGCVFYLVISALEWKKDFYLPHEFLTGISTPVLITAAIATVLFVIMVYFLFERYRENNLAAALYTLFYGETPAAGEPPAVPLPEDKTALLFTPEEREIAILLTDGLYQYEIARKLHKKSGEVGEQIKTIREKVILPDYDDPFMTAIITEYKLTRRETDMLRSLRRNMTNVEIAAELFLSEETVKIHIRNLLKKLKLENRQKFTAWLEDFPKKGDKGDVYA